MTPTAQKKSKRAFVSEQAHTAAYMRGCQGKTRHSSKAMANAVVRLMTSRGEGDRLVLHAYKCRVCKRWHIGNNNRRVFQLPYERVFQSTFYQALTDRLRQAAA